MGLGAPELLIILAVVLVLVGGRKLPELARSLGQAKHELDKGMKEGRSSEPERDGDSSTTT
jgi:sec-independent protein translocase protein TatA